MQPEQPADLDEQRPIANNGLTLSGRQLALITPLLEMFEESNRKLAAKYPEDHREHIFNMGAAEAMLSFKELLIMQWWGTE